MRPKKTILCVASSEQDLSTLAFQLGIWGYRPLKAGTDSEAIQLLNQNQIDLVISDYIVSQKTGNEIIGRMKQISPHVPMILLGDPSKMNGVCLHADAVLHKKKTSAEELSERIRLMSARKRGPRPGTVQAAKQPSALKVCPA